MIVLLGHHPIPLHNFAAIAIGEHLRISGEAFSLHIMATETKSGSAFTAVVPRSLSGPLERYLTVYRPILLTRGGRGAPPSSDALWISEQALPMAKRSVEGRVREHTRSAFGKPLPPSWFRDSAGSIHVDRANVSDMWIVRADTRLAPAKKRDGKAARRARTDPVLMGAIVDRNFETLAVSDLMVTRTRRRLLRAAQAIIEAGVTPPGVDDPEICLSAHGGEFVAPERLSWLEAYGAQLGASANPTGALRLPARAAE